MNINKRILNACNLAKSNIDVTEVLEGIKTDLLVTNDLALESSELFDMLKYKYNKEYAVDIDKVLRC